MLLLISIKQVHNVYINTLSSCYHFIIMLTFLLNIKLHVNEEFNRFLTTIKSRHSGKDTSNLINLPTDKLHIKVIKARGFNLA